MIRDTDEMVESDASTDVASDAEDNEAPGDDGFSARRGLSYRFATEKPE